MRNLVWLAILGVVACDGGGAADDPDETDVTDTDGSADDTDAADTDAADTDDTDAADTDEPVPTLHPMAGTWSGLLDVDYSSSGVVNGNPHSSSTRCATGTLTVTVDPAATPSIAYVAHTCPELDLGTVTFDGSIGRGPGGEPLLVDGRTTASGSVSASGLSSQGAVSWLGEFVDDDADGVVDRLVVDVGPELIGGVNSGNTVVGYYLEVRVALTKTGPLP